VQGRRLGKEIAFYSVWFELRWGITACLMLTVGLITVIFYNTRPPPMSPHSGTVLIVLEANGRVAETYVGFTVRHQAEAANLPARQLEVRSSPEGS
jgi:hypothetical protein